MRGMHCLNTLSKTQAKSSAESELYALERASCEALGSQTLMAELGEVPLAEAVELVDTLARAGQRLVSASHELMKMERLHVGEAGEIVRHDVTDDRPTAEIAAELDWLAGLLRDSAGER